MSITRAETLEPTIRLLHRRWSVPTIGVLHDTGGASFAALVQRLGASRETLAETLASLGETGLVARTYPGPAARPQYLLTAVGETLALACIDAVVAVREAVAVEVALKKWPMIVLIAMGRGAARYRELKAVLPGITGRALGLALNNLTAAGFATRTVDDGYPPGTAYHLTPAGQALFPVMDRLARACAFATSIE